MPQYIPKYKTGETILTDKEKEHQMIIVSTWRTIALHCDDINVDSSSYRSFNNSSPENTYYFVINPDNLDDYYWIFENETEIYCSNTERGLTILRKILTVPFLKRIWGMKEEGAKRFVKNHIET